MKHHSNRPNRSLCSKAAKRKSPPLFKHALLIVLCAASSQLIWATGVSAASISMSHPSGLEVSTTPNPVSNGRTVLLEINTRGQAAPIVGIRAWLKKKPIPVYPHPLKGPGMFIGFIGISYYREAERKEIKLEWTNRSGYHFLKIPIEVQKGQFKREKLRVPKGKVSPTKSDRRRIASERSTIKKIYNTPEPSRLWNSEFAMPAGGVITSPFGTQRLLNGRLKSYHSGVDFRAPTGTPIYAANDGIVRFARNLFYSGNHLIIDHGLGIFTGYSHLSAFSVKPGQRVSKGQEIGRAGATGRTNGPHLHWAAKVNGVSVDPLQLKGLIESVFASQNAPITESE